MAVPRGRRSSLEFNSFRLQRCLFSSAFRTPDTLSRANYQSVASVHAFPQIEMHRRVWRNRLLYRYIGVIVEILSTRSSNQSRLRKKGERMRVRRRTACIDVRYVRRIFKAEAARHILLCVCSSVLQPVNRTINNNASRATRSRRFVWNFQLRIAFTGDIHANDIPTQPTVSFIDES